MTTPQEIHNRDAGEIVKSLVLPTLDAGGDFTDVLVLLESVMVGVFLAGVEPAGHNDVLNAMSARVKERLVEARAMPAKAAS